MIIVSNNTIWDSRGGNAADYGIGFNTVTETEISGWIIKDNLVFGPITISNLRQAAQLKTIYKEIVVDFGPMTGPSTNASGSLQLIGARVGDAVIVHPLTSVSPNFITYSGYVDGTDSVVIIATIVSGTINPPSATFGVTLLNRTI